MSELDSYQKMQRVMIRDIIYISYRDKGKDAAITKLVEMSKDWAEHGGTSIPTKVAEEHVELYIKNNNWKSLELLEACKYALYFIENQYPDGFDKHDQICEHSIRVSRSLKKAIRRAGEEEVNGAETSGGK